MQNTVYTKPFKSLNLEVLKFQNIMIKIVDLNNPYRQDRDFYRNSINSILLEAEECLRKATTIYIVSQLHISFCII